MSRLFFLFIFVANHLMVNGQISPPTLQCVNIDNSSTNTAIRLSWLPSTNTGACSSFNGYEIYASPTRSSTYTLVHLEPNINVTSYSHNVTGTWYYCMRALCPGANSVFSDTLDSEQPVTPDLENISVTGANVSLHWTPSPSPETKGYLIIWQSTSGLVIVDTVWGRNNLSYTHTAASPTFKSETYTISTLDACGVTGLPSTNLHSTIFLKPGLAERCERILPLSWNLYQGFDSISRQELWVSVNGAPAILDTILPDTTKYYAFKDARDGDVSCFYIRAYNETGTVYSQSNTTCASFNLNNPVDYIYLKNVTITDSNTVYLEWYWDTNADLNSSGIDKGNRNEEYSYSQFAALNLRPARYNAFYDNGDLRPDGRKYYRIRATDACDDTLYSNHGSTIYLTVKALDGYINRVTWTPMDIEYAKPVSYYLYRYMNGRKYLVGRLSGNITFFDDKIDPTNNAQQNVCYRVQALATISFPDGTQDAIYSQSNENCAEQFTNIYLPNAFAPDGVNNVFKPLSLFAMNADYSMQIFNRWGQKVFETNNPEQGWDGGDYPQGVYVYVLRMSQTNGNLIERKGTVSLVR